MSSARPRIFVGSSSKQLSIARAVQTNLDEIALVGVWNQVTDLSKDLIEDLSDQLKKADFGVFILAPADVSVIKGKQVSTVRDNVIFEVGLSMGLVGKERTILVVPRNCRRLRIPSDLVGVTYASYDPDDVDDEHPEGLGAACNRIRKLVKRKGRKDDKPVGGSTAHMPVLGKWDCTWWAEGPKRPRRAPAATAKSIEEKVITDFVEITSVTDEFVDGTGINNVGDYELSGRILNANFVTLRYEPKKKGVRQSGTLGGVAILRMNAPRNEMHGFWYEFGRNGEFYGGDTSWVLESEG